ncbi:MDIS1-interacting receptor like kinase 2-like [Cucurbita moschata]|uniref:MDIS1-interacting receptor like kinase 2-like n=1 Tax=Cucurbita moschata TaxID=3662 RepID=A0A6J1GRK3_CUCMO|nr:MDIS1-interacting receptor like kinase 2-like [Cucurbita moschata]
MNSSLFRLPFPLLFIFIFNLASACHVGDRNALLAFKSAITADPSGLLSSWKSAVDCCTWAGVTCSVPNRVTSLSLYGQLDHPNAFLSGTISNSLSNLPYLDSIYLVNLRNISGPFPPSLFKLPKLLFIYIENNKLSGQLPAAIGNMSQLEALSLEGNRFTGPIPSSISKLTRLTQLKLGSNLLTGSIPIGIRQLKSLTFLSLERNRFAGPLPDFWGSFPELRILSLSHNKLTGKIPRSISSLAAKLSYLQIGHNLLTGNIPDFLGTFRALDTLDLSSNHFSGVVPKSFRNLTKIFNLDLSRNSLVDPFPELFVKGIESLDLSYNKFHLGKIPKWVTSSPIIYSLKLAKCGIKMKMEDWKPTQTYFYDYIDLSENEIRGSPVGLLNRTDYLVGFWGSGNKLNFKLQDLRIVKRLKYLDLSRNQVSGKVPGAVVGLEKLNVSYNHLCGPIPATKFPATSFLGNDCLCGPPLPPCK